MFPSTTKKIRKTVISSFWCGYKTHNGRIIKSMPNYQIVGKEGKQKKKEKRKGKFSVQLIKIKFFVWHG
jgi:hypothetical protein